MSGLQPVGDLVDDRLRLLLVGINPGRRSAETGSHFAGPANRFWPALHAAGVTSERLDAARQDELLPLGIGITNLVPRPTPRASEISADELRAGAAALEAKVAVWRPRVVAVLGLTAYRVAFRRPAAMPGRQPEQLAGATLWLLGNPSGLNAHSRPADHAAGLRAVAIAAGVPVDVR